MKQHYFKNCTTLEELKKEYKKLLFQYHPDINPNGTKECQKINAEYDVMFEKLKNTHKNSKNETYTSNTETSETVNEFKDILNAIIRFAGIKIEIIGSWIWVTGNTIACKAELKKLGFTWSNNKKAWYYHTSPFKKRSKNKYNMNDLRNMFDTEEVDPHHEKQAEIA